MSTDTKFVIRRHVGSTRPRMSPWSWAFVAIAVVGIAARVLFVFTAPHQYDADLSVVYLMAKHVAEGEFSPFYWGQSYGGTILQLTAGALFFITGPNPQLLSIVGTMFWLGSALVLRQLALRPLGDLGGNLAAILYWMPCYFTLRESTLDPGFYGPGMLLGLAVILVGLSSGKRFGATRWLALGLLAGLALWTSPASFVMGVPALAIAAHRHRRPWGWILGVLGLCVGALPWIVQLAKSRGGGIVDTTLLQHPLVLVDSLVGLVFQTIPSAFPGGQTTVVRFAVGIIVILSFAWLAIAAVRERDAVRATFLVGTLLIGVVTVIGAGNNVLGDGHTRYTIFFLPAIVLSIADVVRRPPSWVAATVGLAAITLTLGQTAERTQWFRLTTSNAYGAGLSEVSDYLEENGYHAVYASYWLAYRITAETNEDIIAADLAPRRYPPYEVAAAAAPSVVMVFYKDGPNDQAYLHYGPKIPKFTRTVIGDYVIFEFDQKFDPFSRANSFL